MIKIMKCEKTENCFADAKTYRYWLDETIQEETVEYLGVFGEVFVKRNLRRPFFRITMKSGSEIRGMFGDDSVKVSYRGDNWEEEKRWLEEQMNPKRM